MSIDRLSSTSALIAALRAEVVRKGGRASRASSTSTPDKSVASTRRRDVAVLKRELGEIAKGVVPDDREAVNAVRPRIARAILLWEFGAELREHPDWQPMLDDIVRTLENSEQHQLQLSALIKQLRAKS
jgi:hypothetical protein